MDVYVMECLAGQVKVGVSEWSESRLKQIRRTMAAPVRLAHVWRFQFPGVGAAYELERVIHEGLAEFSLGGEWFRCSVDVAIVTSELARCNLLAHAESISMC